MILTVNIVKEKWVDLDNKISLVPGKECLRRIRSWMKEMYNVCPSNAKIIKSMTIDDVDREVLDVFEMLG